MDILSRLGFTITSFLIFYPDLPLSLFPWLKYSQYVDLLFLMEKVFFPCLLLTIFIITLMSKKQRLSLHPGERLILYRIFAWATPAIYCFVALMSTVNLFIRSPNDVLFLPLVGIFSLALYFRFVLLYGKFAHVLYLTYFILLLVSWSVFQSSNQNSPFVITAVYISILPLFIQYQTKG